MSTFLKKLPESEVEITGSLAPEDYGVYRAPVLRKLNKEMNLPGFRRGHIPEKVLIERVGEDYIVEKCVEHALKNVYIDIITEHNLSPLGRPEITSKNEIKAKKPVAFTVHTAVLPAFSLPDYRGIAKMVPKKAPIAIEEKDIDNLLKDIQRLKTRQEQSEESTRRREEDLPPLDDAFAQSSGPFATILELREKLRDNLTLERAKEERERHRLKILETIIEKTEIELPKILVESELGRIFAELRFSIERTTLAWEEYLKQIKKTENDLRREWREQAKKRATASLVLREIGKLEGLEPSKDEITNEVLKILSAYKDADPDRTRQYVEEVLFNDKVFQFLETLSSQI